MKNVNYFDSFERLVLFENDELIESFKDLKIAVKKKACDKNMFFGVAEFMAYKRQLERVKKDIEALKKIPVVKDAIDFNAKYKINYPCLAKLNFN
jgi:hypothetical protein